MAATDRRPIARPDHGRPVLRGPVRRAGRRPAGRHGLLRQVRGRQSDQYRDRRGATGAARGAAHPRRRRSLRALHPRGARPLRGGRLAASSPIRERLTALAVLGIRDEQRFPLLFYRENCADMALCETDVDPAFIRRAGAVLINGTHLSQPGVRAASRKAAELARAAGGRVVFDIDYRPVLWGLTAPDAGENRFVASPAVTARLQEIAPLLRPHRRHGGGIPHPRRLDRHGERAARGARADSGPAGLQAGRARLRGIRGRHRREAGQRRAGAGLRRGGIQHPGRRRRVHERFPARLAARPAARDLLSVWQRLRRHRGLAPRLRAGHAHVDGAVGVSRRQMAAAAARVGGAGAHALGHDARAASGGAVGARDGSPRPPRDARRRARRRGVGVGGLQVAGHRRRRPRRRRRSALRHPARRPLRPPGPGARRRSPVLDRAADRAERLAPAGCSTARRMLARRCAPGRRITWSNVWLRYHPDDPEMLRQRQEERLLCLHSACRETRHELLLEVIASPYGDMRAGHHRPSARAAVRPRYPPGLVEARAERRPGGLGRDSGHDPPARPVVPRRPGAGSGRRRATASRRPSGPRRRSSWYAASRLGVPSSQSPPGGGSPARSATPRRWPRSPPTCRPSWPHGARRGRIRRPESQETARDADPSHRRPGRRALPGEPVHRRNRAPRVPYFAGAWAIFGHGNVAGLGEALHAAGDALPTYRAHNEQSMAHAAIAFAKASRRRRAHGLHQLHRSRRAQHGDRRRASRTSTACRCSSCRETSSPGAGPIRCCSRWRISPTAR